MRILLLLLVSWNVWAADYWVCDDGAGATDGSSLANCFNDGSDVAWGGASAVGRGDRLFVVGILDEALAPSGIGAFDGTVNASADVMEISGNATDSGGAAGGFSTITGNAILASGMPAVYVHDLSFANITASGVSQLFGSTNGCLVSGAFYCSRIYNITCSSVGTSSGSCVNVGAAGNTNTPADPVQGVYISDVTSAGGGGSACRKRLNTTNAIIENCTSRGGEGSVSNTWPVYAAGIVLNCGTANSGAGVTWTNVAGTVYKASQVSCGATTGATIIDVSAGNPAAGVAQILALDGSCTGDGDCAGTSGTWGQVSDTVYVNKGDVVQPTAAIDLVYEESTGTIIRGAMVYDASDAFDGNSIGLDFGEDSGIIEQSYSENAPTFGFVSGRGTVGNVIRSSISNNSGDASIRVNGTSSVFNFSSAGDADIVDALIHTGETLTIKNVGGSGVTNVYTDALEEGTITASNNSSDAPLYVGGTSPATTAGFRLSPSSPLRSAGTNVGSLQDYGNRRYAAKPSIGAWEAGSGDARATVTARTTVTAR